MASVVYVATSTTEVTAQTASTADVITNSVITDVVVSNLQGPQGTPGESGIVSVVAPITNTGTSSAAVIGIDASSADTANYVVRRDANGEFVTGAVTIDSTKTPTSAVGKMYWDGGGTVNLGLLGGNVSVALGENLVSYVTNAEATTLAVGETVYVYGATGDRPSVKRAYNTGDATSSKTLGFVAESIGANQTGFVVTRGIIGKLNLGAYTPGQAVYLGSTAGTFTTTKPSAPNHLVSLGWVVRANNGNGQIYVNVQNGFELQELHNVAIASVADGQVLTYDSATQLWKNENPVAPTTPATPTVAGVVYGLTEDDNTQNGNSAIGNYALNANTTGYNNVAVGLSALLNNTTGGDNVALGAYAAIFNETGDDNVAIGNGALTFNVSGVQNVAIGKSALVANTANENTGIGYGTLSANTTGTQNIALGSAALASNISGNTNTAIGVYAGYAALGSGNVFIGNQAGQTYTGSNKLYIANHPTTSLIVGDFSAKTLIIDGTVTATSYAVPSGTSSGFLKADGTVDSTAYSTLVTGTATPAALGTAAAGSATAASHEDHIHPTTGLAVLASANTFTGGVQQINAPADATKGLIVKAFSATQSANLFEVQSSAGAVISSIAGNGRIVTTVPLLINTAGSSYSAMLAISPSTTTTIGAVIRGAASQTANLQEWQNSAGTVVGFVGFAGQTSIGGNNVYGGTLGVTALNASTPGIMVQGASSQTADLQQWRSSASTTLGGANALAQTYTGSTSPILVATGGATTAASGTGTTATITTTSAHGLAVGDLVTVAGVAPTGYNGTYLITAVTSTTISYANATTGAQTVAGTVSAPAQASVTTRSAGTVGLVIRGATSQAADFMQFQNSAGANQILIKFNGSINARYFDSVGVAGAYIDNAATSGSLSIIGRQSAAVTLITKGSVSATADLQQWQNSAGTVLALVNSIGRVSINSSADPGGSALNVNQPSGGIGITINGSGSAGSAINVLPAAGSLGIVVKGAASQTADLQQWQNSAGTVLASISSNGTISSSQSIGATANVYAAYGKMAANTQSTFYGQISAITASTTTVGIVIRGIASQTADLQQWQNSGGTNLTTISSAGTINFASGNTSATATAGAVTLPALAVGFITFQIAGTTVKVPYYAA